MLIFCTTPEFIATKFEELLQAVSKDSQIHVPKSAKNYVPAAVLIVVSKVSPFIMSSSIKLMGYWRQSKINYYILRQTSAYLLLVVLLLPTFSFLTIKAFISFSWQMASVTLYNDFQQHWEW